jgi:hypothetical protein
MAAPIHGDALSAAEPLAAEVLASDDEWQPGRQSLDGLDELPQHVDWQGDNPFSTDDDSLHTTVPGLTTPPFGTTMIPLRM